MDEKKKNSHVIFYAIGTALVAAVLVLCFFVFSMRQEIEQMRGSVTVGMQDNGSGPSDAAGKGSAKQSLSKKPGAGDNDLLNAPFDPEHWDPFSEMERMQDQVNHLFSNAFSRFGESEKFGNLARAQVFSPKIDVVEKKNDFVITVDLPGVSEGNLNVDVDGKNVTLSGERVRQSKQTNSKGDVVVEERRVGEFSRTITLPEPVDSKKVVADNKDGVFTITLKKTAQG